LFVNVGNFNHEVSTKAVLQQLTETIFNYDIFSQAMFIVKWISIDLGQFSNRIIER
jgi:hypothetical protein